MSFNVIPIKENCYELYDYIIDGLKDAQSYEYPESMTSPWSKSKYFKRHHPEYHKIPNSILRGVFKFSNFKSDGMKGLKFKGSWNLHIWGLGCLDLCKPVIRPHKVKQISFRPNHEIILHGMGSIGSRKKITLRDYSTADLTQLMREDPIFRYLKVNGVFAEYGHRKAGIVHDVIEHFEHDPNMTRQQMENLGIRGDKLWDIVTNYQKSLDEWIRAGSKPKDYKKGHYFLSKGQHRQRLKHEWSIPDHLSSSDVESGKLKKQSFDSQVYEMTRSDRWSFYN